MQRGLVFLLLAFGLVGIGYFWQNSFERQEPQSRAVPEIGTGFYAKEEVTSKDFMVATANKHASQAAKMILEKGGSAVDAAIAAQLMLNLVEPQSSGIGGGAFLLVFDPTTKQLKSYDGRETAPAAVTERLFLRDDGSALGFGEAVRSGRSIGVPGLVAVLEKVHKAHGRLPFHQLFDPTIQLAEQGFAVSRRLHLMLKRKGSAFFNKEAQVLFFDEAGTARAEGWILKNTALAHSLSLLAEKGASGFYTGPLAREIVKTAKAAPTVPSAMTLNDLARYKAVERQPVCGIYQAYKICGMGPPSSGGMTTAMILGVLDEFDLGKGLSVEALHLIGEAEKLAFADRNRYMADADFVPQPHGLLDPAYLAKRRALIDPKKAMAKAAPGNPPLLKKSDFGQDGTVELGGTSHISIVDKDGMVISMTSSIEGAFGSGQMVQGFLLNNQLTDFSFRPKDDNGVLIANRVAPLKRPRSSMAPTIVFDRQGQPIIIVGSPGGSRIISFVVKSLIAHINWGMGPQEAVSLLNFGSRNGPFELENRPKSASLKAALEALGQKVKLGVMTSGVQMIVRDDDGFRGGTDPRREGVVLGE